MRITLKERSILRFRFAQGFSRPRFRKVSWFAYRRVRFILHSNRRWLIVQRERLGGRFCLQVGDDDLALADAPLARARTFWRLSARFLNYSISAAQAGFAATLADSLEG